MHLNLGIDGPQGMLLCLCFWFLRKGFGDLTNFFDFVGMKFTKDKLTDISRKRLSGAESSRKKKKWTVLVRLSPSIIELFVPSSTLNVAAIETRAGCTREELLEVEVIGSSIPKVFKVALDVLSLTSITPSKSPSEKA